MATLIVIAGSPGPSLKNGILRQSRIRACGSERIEIAPTIGGFHEVDAVPLESLLREQFRAELLKKGACRLVACQHPHDDAIRMLRSQRCDDRADEHVADAPTLELAAHVDAGQL